MVLSQNSDLQMNSETIKVYNSVLEHIYVNIFSCINNKNYNFTNKQKG